MNVIVSFLVITVFLFPQETKNMNWLVGSWEGTGQLFGQNAVYQMEWKSKWDGKFYQLEFANRFESSENSIIEATAFYSIDKNNEPVGKWFDSRGYFLPIKSVLTGNELVSFWGTTNDAEQGKTVYRLVNENEIEVKDFVLKDSVYSQFGQAIYKKVNN